jgi:uncharacterized protein YndB with AHSA1/START domain
MTGPEDFTMKINDEPAQFNGPAEVRLVRTLPGPIERVWEYLTDSEKRAKWFAGGPMEPRPGGKLTLHFHHKNLAPDETPPEDHAQFHDPGHSMEVKVTRYEPPRALAYTFGSDQESEVTFELTARGKEVLLVLTHRSRGGDIPYMTGFASGWHTHLTHLIALLEGAPRPPFWPLHASLKKRYAELRSSLT